MYACIFVGTYLCMHYVCTLQDMSPPSQRRQQRGRRSIEPAVRSSWIVLTTDYPVGTELYRPIRSLYTGVYAVSHRHCLTLRLAALDRCLWPQTNFSTTAWQMDYCTTTQFLGYQQIFKKSREMNSFFTSKILDSSNSALFCESMNFNTFPVIFTDSWIVAENKR
jgi:hypothetical protein